MSMDQVNGEPVAIVGIGCRLPGGIETPAALWRGLLDGIDAVRETPCGRRAAARRGGFLDDIAGFDASLFRVPPAEARHMDPRRRIALETSWAALEDARIVPDELARGRTGVFVGTTARRSDPSLVPASIARTLGLDAPVAAVSALCDSSLSAAHLAVRALRDNSVDLALAGGVQVLHGRHGAVHDVAGPVRGEGCGVLVLRRLSDALAAGDRIYALIRGSARAAAGPQPQADAARAAWQDAGVATRHVSYAEVHGAGAAALAALFGGADALRIGAAPANFGHLEPAAGVVALMRTALALHHGELPAGLGRTTPGPLLDVVAAPEPWPGEARRYAGVGGPGSDGTEIHLALEEAPHRHRIFVPLAAESATALRAAADELTDRVRTGRAWYAPELLGRATGGHRAVAAVTHPGDLAGALRAGVAAHAQGPVRRPDALAFCFSGPGPRWRGMGRELFGEPAFRAALDACDRALRPFTGRSVTADLLADRTHPGPARPDADGPVRFALQTALARTLGAWGVEPTAVFGEGAGEVAAAVFAGALPLTEGARLTAAWSRTATGADAEQPARIRELTERLGVLETRSATVPFWSATAGGYADGAELDAAYWARALCARPPLAEAARALAGGRGLRVVEIAPHPVAGPALQSALDALGGEQPRVLAAGHRERPARQALEDVAAALWCDGADVDWGAVTGRRPRRAAPVPVALTVSGRTPRARAENALRLAAHLDATPDAALLDVAYTAARHRPHLEHRASVVADSAAQAARALRALAAGLAHPGLVTGTAAAGPRLAMLFGGPGPHRAGPARELYAAFPAFRRALDEVCAALDPQLPLPLVAVVFAAQDGPDAALLGEPEFAQPALFALEVALFRMWASWGVVPAAVAGHGVGEVTAAHVSGALGLADAARLAAARGRAARRGDEGAAGAQEFARAAAECAFSEPELTWVSTVTGTAVPAGPAPDPAHWARQLAGPARFADAVRTLERAGVGRYLECGPPGPLSALAASRLHRPAVFVTAQGSLPRPAGAARALVQALSALHVAGEDITWDRVFATGVPVDLPTYAFQREHPGTVRLPGTSGPQVRIKIRS
ncbi:acyltransferase domain-containing protein [Streptomyces sp. NPDC006552]|uniref:acyltransferase domain-containing protein n=1 Tax=Streptomyces sp. NPDC006552 TaxID=3157179 RepID=UPI0033A38986